MARTWRNERTTPKQPTLRAPTRPRMDEFAREYYQGKGYTVESTVTDTDYDGTIAEARAYLEVDYD